MVSIFECRDAAGRRKKLRCYLNARYGFPGLGYYRHARMAPLALRVDGTRRPENDEVLTPVLEMIYGKYTLCFLTMSNEMGPLEKCL